MYIQNNVDQDTSQVSKRSLGKDATNEKHNLLLDNRQ